MSSGYSVSRSSLVAALAAGGVVFLLGISALRREALVSDLTRRALVSDQLASLGTDISTELFGVFTELSLAAGKVASPTGASAEALTRLRERSYALWRKRGGDFDVLIDARVNVSAEQVGEALGRSELALIGPVATADGGQALLVRVPAGAGNAADDALLSLLRLDDLLSSVGVERFLQTGMGLEIVTEDGRHVYWSSPNTLAEPVTESINLLGRRWGLVAAPLAGWYPLGSSWASLSLLWVLTAGYAVACLALLGRPAYLSAQLAELNTRFDERNTEFVTLLQSRSELEAQLIDSRTLDLATGLPSRTSFIDYLRERLSDKRLNSNGFILVAAIHFPKLEEIRSSFGVSVADGLVADAADRLGRLFEDGLFVARTTDKELACCVSHETNPAPREFADVVLQALAERYTIGRHTIYSPVLVGLAVCRDGYDHAPDLLANASLAATSATMDSNPWVLFEPKVKEKRISGIQLEADLEMAIPNTELRLHFQPIVSVASGNVVGFESLLRWNHWNGDIIGPDRFLPIAENVGLMPKISEWVVQEGVAHAKQWRHLREEPVYLTVNLTPRDLSRDFCNYIFRLIAEAGIPPRCLRVEITETAVVRDARVAGRLINELNERGVLVLLDDFGTGYSSLSYLRDLPFAAIKIDRSFVSGMTSEARDLGLVKSIVDLVHYLGMECVAEGVETQEQLDLIAMVNCDYWQGYLLTSPVAASEVESVLNAAGGKRAGSVTA